jgi:hypothetical protein
MTQQPKPNQKRSQKSITAKSNKIRNTSHTITSQTPPPNNSKHTLKPKPDLQQQNMSPPYHLRQYRNTNTQHRDTQEQKKTTTTFGGGAAKLNHNHCRSPRSRTRSPPF